MMCMLRESGCISVDDGGLDIFSSDRFMMP